MHGRTLLPTLVAAGLLAAPASAATHAGHVSVRSGLEGDHDIREDFRYTVRWLVYEARPGQDNRLRVRFYGATTVLTDPAGVEARAGCRQRSRTRVSCRQRGRTSAVYAAANFALGDGNDELRMRGVSRDATTVVLAGAGDDVVRGSAGADHITGGPGADALSGRDGDDAFYGRAANDGADRVSGGAHADRVTYAARAAAVHADLEGDADDGEAGEGDRIGCDVESLGGGSGTDELIGNGGDNRLNGGADGADRLHAGGGDDRLLARGAGLLLDGGHGVDVLDARGAAATLDGGPGRDAINDQSGDDGAPSVIAAQDGAPDEIACQGAGDGVSADARDMVAGCTAITRTGAPAARLLFALSSGGGLRAGAFSRRVDWSPYDGGVVDLTLGCPLDMGAACRLRLELLLGKRRLLRQRATVAPGAVADHEVGLSRRQFELAKARTVTARVETTDRDGATIVQRERISIRRSRFG